MRAVVTRVLEARVEVGGNVVGAIEQGVLVLLGVGRDDTPEHARKLARKIHELRIFRDEAGAMNRSLADTGGAALVVSQFTLYADTSRGRRPSFVLAAPPDLGRELYAAFVADLRALGTSVATGEFGAMMLVESVNDGPVTIVLDTA